MLLLLGIPPKHMRFFPQQRKLLGSSAQISSGVRRSGSQEQVPKEGCGRFRRVPLCAGVGSRGKFRKVPEGSGVCWCGEGCGGFRRVPVRAGVGSGGKLRRQVPEASSGGKFWRQVPECSREFGCVLVYKFRRQSSEGSGEFRCGLLPGNLDRSSHVIALNTFW